MDRQPLRFRDSILVDMQMSELLTAANADSRGPGHWTPGARKVWREADPEDARLLEAPIAMALPIGRSVRERRRQMDEVTGAAKAARLRQESSFLKQ